MNSLTHHHHINLTSHHNPFLLFILILCLISQTNSLSTVSISSIGTGNQTTHIICAITQQFNLNCTSFPTRSILIPSHNYTYSRIVGGDGFVCGVIRHTSTTTSVMVCWRFSSSSSTNDTIFKRIYRGPVIDELKAGNSHICGIVRANGKSEIKCWQWKGSSFLTNQLNRDGKNFTSIAVGDDFVCGLDTIGEISCVGEEKVNITAVPSGNVYNVIEAAGLFACGIAVNGSLSCWGKSKMIGVIPDEEFSSLALGDQNRGCGVRVNGTVVCWGDDDGRSSRFSVPVDLQNSSFTAIEVKRSMFCGILSSNYSLLCWGNGGNYSLVFENVLPGSCSVPVQCKCGQLPGTGNICGSGKVICRQQSCNPTNNNSTSIQPPLMSPISPPPENKNRNFWTTKTVIFLVVGITGSLILLASVVICLVIRNSKAGGSSRVHDDSGPLDLEITSIPHRNNSNQRQRSLHKEVQEDHPARGSLVKKLSDIASMGNQRLEEFPLHLLLDATNNFSLDHKIGHGSFGSVYVANLLNDSDDDTSRFVAIKRGELLVSPSIAGTTAVAASTMKKKNEDRDTAFLAELESLSHLNHRNLVRLIGFCEESGERILVYEYMSNGTLHDHLHRKYKGGRCMSSSSSSESTPIATWRGRIKAVLDAARGIEYLHVYSVPPVIHRDIKSSNILLDTNWTAKVSDFGLSLMTTTTTTPSSSSGSSHISLLAAGTLGYIDPEYYRRHQLTTRSDVYSFGVVLLEVLSGKKAIHLNEDGFPRNVVDYVVPYIDRDEIHRVIDRSLPPPTPFEIEAVGDVGRIAGECVRLESKDRPDMNVVVGCLERAWKMMECQYGDGFVMSRVLSESVEEEDN